MFHNTRTLYIYTQTVHSCFMSIWFSMLFLNMITKNTFAQIKDKTICPSDRHCYIRCPPMMSYRHLFTLTTRMLALTNDYGRRHMLDMTIRLFFFKRNGILCCHFCHLHNLWYIPTIVSFAISDNIFVANWQWNLVFREDIFRYIQSKIYLQPMLNKYTLLFCLIPYPYLAFINLILDIKIIPFSLLKIKSKKKSK